jgi:ribosomal protein S18 acetylase RimI-like enzyme
MIAIATMLNVRASVWEDRANIYDLLISSKIFGKTDADCVDEMFVETWEKPREDGYHWLSCWEDDRMIGFACFGTESLTKDTWDLFWVCVRPEARGKGAGRMLIDEATHQAQLANGRLMVIYTSSTPIYAPARKLYESAGFAQTAIVPDYYSEGDSLFIYSRRLK